MNKTIKKTLLALSSLATVASPIAAVISCGNDKKPGPKHLAQNNNAKTDTPSTDAPTTVTESNIAKKEAMKTLLTSVYPNIATVDISNVEIKQSGLNVHIDSVTKHSDYAVTFTFNKDVNNAIGEGKNIKKDGKLSIVTFSDEAVVGTLLENSSTEASKFEQITGSQLAAIRTAIKSQGVEYNESAENIDLKTPESLFSAEYDSSKTKEQIDQLIRGSEELRQDMFGTNLPTLTNDFVYRIKSQTFANGKYDLTIEIAKRLLGSSEVNKNKIDEIHVKINPHVPFDFSADMAHLPRTLVSSLGLSDVLRTISNSGTSAETLGFAPIQLSTWTSVKFEVAKQNGRAKLDSQGRYLISVSMAHLGDTSRTVEIPLVPFTLEQDIKKVINLVSTKEFAVLKHDITENGHPKAHVTAEELGIHAHSLSTGVHETFAISRIKEYNKEIDVTVTLSKGSETQTKTITISAAPEKGFTAKEKEDLTRVMYSLQSTLNEFEFNKILQTKNTGDIVTLQQLGITLERLPIGVSIKNLKIKTVGGNPAVVITLTKGNDEYERFMRVTPRPFIINSAVGQAMRTSLLTTKTQAEINAIPAGIVTPEQLGITLPSFPEHYSVLIGKMPQGIGYFATYDGIYLGRMAPLHITYSRITTSLKQALNAPLTSTKTQVDLEEIKTNEITPEQLGITLPQLPQGVQVSITRSADGNHGFVYTLSEGGHQQPAHELHIVPFVVPEEVMHAFSSTIESTKTKPELNMIRQGVVTPEALGISIPTLPANWGLTLNKVVNEDDASSKIVVSLRFNGNEVKTAEEIVLSVSPKEPTPEMLASVSGVFHSTKSQVTLDAVQYPATPEQLGITLPSFPDGWTTIIGKTPNGIIMGFRYNGVLTSTRVNLHIAPAEIPANIVSEFHHGFVSTKTQAELDELGARPSAEELGITLPKLPEGWIAVLVKRGSVYEAYIAHERERFGSLTFNVTPRVAHNFDNEERTVRSNTHSSLHKDELAKLVVGSKVTETQLGIQTPMLSDGTTIEYTVKTNVNGEVMISFEMNNGLDQVSGKVNIEAAPGFSSLVKRQIMIEIDKSLKTSKLRTYFTQAEFGNWFGKLDKVNSDISLEDMRISNGNSNLPNGITLSHFELIVVPPSEKLPKGGARIGMVFVKDGIEISMMLQPVYLTYSQASLDFTQDSHTVPARSFEQGLFTTNEQIKSGIQTRSIHDAVFVVNQLQTNTEGVIYTANQLMIDEKLIKTWNANGVGVKFKAHGPFNRLGLPTVVDALIYKDGKLVRTVNGLRITYDDSETSSHDVIWRNEQHALEALKAEQERIHIQELQQAAREKQRLEELLKQSKARWELGAKEEPTSELFSQYIQWVREQQAVIDGNLSQNQVQTVAPDIYKVPETPEQPAPEVIVPQLTTSVSSVSEAEQVAMMDRVFVAAHKSELMTDGDGNLFTQPTVPVEIELDVQQTHTVFSGLKEHSDGKCYVPIESLGINRDEVFPFVPTDTKIYLILPNRSLMTLGLIKTTGFTIAYEINGHMIPSKDALNISNTVVFKMSSDFNALLSNPELLSTYMIMFKGQHLTEEMKEALRSLEVGQSISMNKLFNKEIRSNGNIIKLLKINETQFDFIVEKEGKVFVLRLASALNAILYPTPH